MKRSGVADLPLHGGRVPPWLAERMTKLGTAISESVLYHYGASELLSRLSDPFWFQALGSVMGMDWHSSGITTSVMGALKRGLNPRAHELGIYVCGGRGKHSRKAPDELRAVADRESLNGDDLARTSRLTAKIDNNAIADGFQLYLHSFVVSKAGEWTVVQQGMNDSTGLARRYHWHSANVRDFTSDPHTAIVGESVMPGEIMNLVDHRAKQAQTALLEIARESPDRTLREVPRLVMPPHHDVREKDVDLKRLGAVLAMAYERQLRDFASLLLLENLGPRTLQSLALIAEVVHGAPTRFADPARFSFAHGGKDGHPFPVPLKTYDESLSVLRRALQQAKVGHTEKIDGFGRLDRFTRTIEKRALPEADFQAALAHEHAISPSLDGRTVFNDRKKMAKQKMVSSYLCSDFFSKNGLPRLRPSVYTHAMTKRLFLSFFIALASVPGIAQCCPEKPAAEKREALWQKLQEDIRSVDRSLDGVMGLAVKDLTSGETFFIHGDEIMPQASSIKIAVLADLYLQAQQGKLKLTDEYVLRQADLVSGSDIMLGLTPGVTRLTLRDLATMMVAVSDNSATNVLIRRLGMENVNAMLDGLGLHSTRLRREMMDLKAAGEGRENVSTPREMMTLLETIYRGKLLNKEMTADFIKMLSTHKESSLLQGLPDDVAAANKPGELEAVRNDSGIILLKGRPYILCVMTTYLKDEKDGSAAIRKISALAYSYFDRLARASEYGRVVSPK